MKIKKGIELFYQKLKIINKGSVQEQVTSVEQYKLNELLVEGYKKHGLNLADWETTVFDNWD